MWLVDKLLEAITSLPLVALFVLESLPSWNKTIAIARGNRYAAAGETAGWRLVGKQKVMALRRRKPQAIPIVKEKCLVLVSVWRKGRQRYDVHNLDVKSVFDGLTDGGLWSDDHAEIVPTVIFHHAGVDKKNPRIEIAIYEL